jgi:hypothetical protein
MPFHCLRLRRLREWLQEREYNPDEMLSFEDDNRPGAERRASDRKAVAVCLRLWLEERGVKTGNLGDQSPHRPRAAHDKAKDIVNEQEHIPAFVAKIFGHRQAGELVAVVDSEYYIEVIQIYST